MLYPFGFVSAVKTAVELAAVFRKSAWFRCYSGGRSYTPRLFALGAFSDNFYRGPASAHHHMTNADMFCPRLAGLAE